MFTLTFFQLADLTSQCFNWPQAPIGSKP
ncbi:hypothetical protein YPPY02_1888, partial [Yersinia pestis PY-02]